MGFPISYSEAVIPELVIQTISALGFIISFIVSVFHLLGLFRHLIPTQQEGHGAPAPPSTASHPLPALMLRELLPVARFEELNRVGSGDLPESCAVCLSEFEGREEVPELRNCRHLFHRACLDRWMDNDRMTCPLCRAGLVPDEMRDEFNRRLWASSGVADF